MKHWISIFLSFALAGCATLDIKIARRAGDSQMRKDREFASSESAKEIAAGAPAALFDQAQSLPWTDERRLTLLLESARAILADGNFSAGAEHLYNLVVRQIVAMLGAGGIKDRALRGAGGLTRLAVARTGAEIVDPGQWDSLVPAADVRIKRLQNRSVQPGWGVPYVAYFPKTAGFLAGQPGIPRAGMCLPVTALVKFRGDTATLCFFNTLRTDTVFLSNQTLPLAADYSAAIAVLLSRSKNRSIDLGALFFSRQRVVGNRLVPTRALRSRQDTRRVCARAALTSGSLDTSCQRVACRSDDPQELPILAVPIPDRSSGLAIHVGPSRRVGPF